MNPRGQVLHGGLFAVIAVLLASGCGGSVAADDPTTVRVLSATEVEKRFRQGGVALLMHRLERNTNGPLAIGTPVFDPNPRSQFEVLVFATAAAADARADLSTGDRAVRAANNVVVVYRRGTKPDRLDEIERILARLE